MSGVPPHESATGVGPGFLEDAHRALDRFLVQSGADPEVAMLFRMGVAEIASNLIEHAYAGVPGGPMTMRLFLTDGSLHAELQDNGRPLPDGARPRAADDLAEGGRGLAMAISALDEVHYLSDGRQRNHWLLVKYLIRPAAVE
jgi:serine/threonine-protein kinase RsbW